MCVRVQVRVCMRVHVCMRVWRVRKNKRWALSFLEENAPVNQVDFTVNYET